jgi:hypothetical protein
MMTSTSYSTMSFNICMHKQGQSWLPMTLAEVVLHREWALGRAVELICRLYDG